MHVIDVAAAHHRLGSPAEVLALSERILQVPGMHPTAVALARARLEARAPRSVIRPAART